MSERENELEPCPKCKGQITIYTNIERGAFARCNQCKSEFGVCSVKEIPTYNGVKIRKNTILKIKKEWNRRAKNDI